MFEHFVGVDVSKDSFSFNVTDLKEKTLEKGSCGMNHEGFENFFSIISKFGNVSVGLESTATYHQPLLFALLAREIPTYLITPFLVKNFARSCSLRNTKTDTIDARIISVFLGKNYAGLRPVSASDGNGLREIARLRESISKKSVAAKIRLKQLVTTTFPELVKEHDIFTVSMITLLEEFPSAEAIRKASLKKIEKVLNSKTKGRNPKLNAEQIKALAAKSVGVCKPMLEKTVLHIIRELNFLTDELKKCDKELIEAVSVYSHEDFEILTSIPGIGKLTAAQFIAEIGDINRFETVKQLTAYAGTDPGISQSGNSLVQKRISKRGNSSVRRIGFLTALHLISMNKVFKEYYDKKIRENMNGKKAVIAVFNKFLRCVFSMLKNKKTFSFNYS
ncbi:IS110 family transposase [bacterium]|nr:IS110 family transposase [bacterium]